MAFAPGRVATAEAGDQERAARIKAHKTSRPASWDTLGEPLNLPIELESLLSDYDTVLVDCMALWISNMLLSDAADPDLKDIPTLAKELLVLYKRSTASWIIVSNEVGLGVGSSTELGRVNQMVAAEADAVYSTVAGLSLKALNTDDHVT